MSRTGVCWAAFVNSLVIIVMLMLLTRCLIGFQDDIATRFRSVMWSCMKVGANTTASN